MYFPNNPVNVVRLRHLSISPKLNLQTALYDPRLSSCCSLQGVIQKIWIICEHVISTQLYTCKNLNSHIHRHVDLCTCALSDLVACSLAWIVLHLHYDTKFFPDNWAQDKFQKLMKDLSDKKLQLKVSKEEYLKTLICVVYFSNIYKFKKSDFVLLITGCMQNERYNGVHVRTSYISSTHFFKQNSLVEGFVNKSWPINLSFPLTK